MMALGSGVSGGGGASWIDKYAVTTAVALIFHCLPCWLAVNAPHLVRLVDAEAPGWVQATRSGVARSLSICMTTCRTEEL